MLVALSFSFSFYSISGCAIFSKLVLSLPELPFFLTYTFRGGDPQTRPLRKGKRKERKKKVSQEKRGKNIPRTFQPLAVSFYCYRDASIPPPPPLFRHCLLAPFSLCLLLSVFFFSAAVSLISLLWLLLPSAKGKGGFCLTIKVPSLPPVSQPHFFYDEISSSLH